MVLIDADKLYSERPEFLNPIHEENGEFNKGWNACINTFCDIIKEQPTAYNVDKIVEELEELKQYVFSEMKGRRNGKSLALGYIRGIQEAIDIIKRGGKDDTQ